MNHEGTVETVIQESTTVENTSCNTSHLSSLFASFLTGGGAIEMGYQKYFIVYRGKATKLREDYERDYRAPSALIDRIDVRISSTSRDEDGYYYATFIGTFNGSPPYLKEEDDDESELSVALAVGDKILAFAPFDIAVYREVLDGSRVEIKWRLQLKHVTTIKHTIRETVKREEP